MFSRLPFAWQESIMTRISDKHYKCPNCKHEILLTSAEFIQGMAVASCADCGRDAFAIEEMFLDG